jgi:accessory gene regulator protein AgrB
MGSEMASPFIGEHNKHKKKKLIFVIYIDPTKIQVIIADVLKRSIFLSNSAQSALVFRKIDLREL